MDGAISKSLLVVSPAAASVAFTQKVRHELYVAGFIVVREEFRTLNAELVDKLSQSGIDVDDSRSELVGDAYLFVVARSDVGELLGSFVAEHTELHGSVFIARSRPHLGGRAVTLLFPKMVCDNIPNSVEAREYVQEELKGLLLSGLTELAKQKPQHPIEWLAHYLLENNPRSPPITLA